MAIAALIAIMLNVNKATARKFFVEHYSATEKDSRLALEKLADATVFTSLNAAAICVAIRVRKNLSGLKETQLKERFNNLWREGSIMRMAHSLELAKKLSDASTFKLELGRLVTNPKG